MDPQPSQSVRGTRAQRRALAAYVRLIRAAEAATTRIHRPLAAQGLTVSQFGVLEALHSLGTLSQRDIGAKILRTSGDVTLVIDNLERRGWVRRDRSLEDRRLVMVSLTSAGAELITGLFTEHARTVAADFAALTPEELGLLEGLCRKIEKRQHEK